MDALEDGVVDGNAIGGLLIEVFGTEMTTAVVTCAQCGATGQVAELAVYRPGLGTVVRCRSCDNVLMVFVEIRRRDLRRPDGPGAARLSWGGRGSPGGTRLARCRCCGSACGARAGSPRAVRSHEATGSPGWLRPRRKRSTRVSSTTC